MKVSLTLASFLLVHGQYPAGGAHKPFVEGQKAHVLESLLSRAAEDKCKASKPRKA